MSTYKNAETKKTEKKMQNDENVEKLEDVVNKQVIIEMCSVGLYHSLMVFVMAVHCVGQHEFRRTYFRRRLLTMFEKGFASFRHSPHPHPVLCVRVNHASEFINCV